MHKPRLRTSHGDVLVPMVPLAPVGPGMLGTISLALSSERLLHATSSLDYARGFISLALGIAVTALSFLWTQKLMQHRSFQPMITLCIATSAIDVLSGYRTMASPYLIILAVCAGLLLVDPQWFLCTMGILLMAWAISSFDSSVNRTVEFITMGATLTLGQAARETRRIGGDVVKRLNDGKALNVIDQATGLPDRQGVQLVAAHLVAIAERNSESLSCTMIEVSHYDQISSALGPEGIDVFMRDLAGRVSSIMRTTDVVGRWSESQFAIVTHGNGVPVHVFEARLRKVIVGASPLPTHAWDRKVRIARAVIHPWDDESLLGALAATEQALARHDETVTVIDDETKVSAYDDDDDDDVPAQKLDPDNEPFAEPTLPTREPLRAPEAQLNRAHSRLAEPSKTQMTPPVQAEPRRETANHENPSVRQPPKHEPPAAHTPGASSFPTPQLPAQRLRPGAPEPAVHAAPTPASVWWN